MDWSNGKFLAGQAEVGDAVSMPLRQWAARRAKDEAEIDNARDRARALQSKAIPSGDAPAAPAAAANKFGKGGQGQRPKKLTAGAPAGVPS